MKESDDLSIFLKRSLAKIHVRLQNIADSKKARTETPEAQSVASSPSEAITAPKASSLSKVSSPDAMDATGETTEPHIGNPSDQGELARSEAEPNEDFVQKPSEKGSSFAQAIEKAQGIDRGGSPLVANVSAWYEVFELALEGLVEVEAQKEARQTGKRRFRSQKLAARQSKGAVDPQELDKQRRERARRLADRIVFLAQVFGIDGIQAVEKLTRRLRQKASGKGPSPTIPQSVEPMPEAASPTATRFVSEWWMGVDLRARGNEQRFERYIRETTLYRLHESLIREFEDEQTTRIVSW